MFPVTFATLSSARLVMFGSLRPPHCYEKKEIKQSKNSFGFLVGNKTERCQIKVRAQTHGQCIDQKRGRIFRCQVGAS